MGMYSVQLIDLSWKEIDSETCLERERKLEECENADWSTRLLGLRIFDIYILWFILHSNGLKTSIGFFQENCR